MIRKTIMLVLTSSATVALVLWVATRHGEYTIVRRDYGIQGQRVSPLEIGTIAPNWGIHLFVDQGYLMLRWHTCRLIDQLTPIRDVRRSLVLGGYRWGSLPLYFDAAALGGSGNPWREVRIRLVYLHLWAVALLLAAFPIFALVRNPVRAWRRRRKGLCVYCGYNLTGLPEPRCPECGRGVGTERRASRVEPTQAD